MTSSDLFIQGTGCYVESEKKLNQLAMYLKLLYETAFMQYSCNSSTETHMNSEFIMSMHFVQYGYFLYNRTSVCITNNACGLLLDKSQLRISALEEFIRSRAQILMNKIRNSQQLLYVPRSQEAAGILLKCCSSFAGVHD